MPEKYYVDTIGTDIIVDIGESITEASNTKLKVLKPGGAKVEWNASIYNVNYLKYTIQEGDWDKVGIYKLHSYLTIGDWTGHGDVATFTVLELYNN